MDNTTQEVEDFLRTHNIPFKALNHLPITTCEEGLKIAKEFGSTCCKTLLVKNKKQFFSLCDTGGNEPISAAAISFSLG